MSIKNYIWDFDGTLYDTYPHTLAAFCETARRRGMEIDPDEAYRQMRITLWDAFRFYKVDDAFIEQFYGIENDLSFRPHGAPFSQIPEMLRYIAAHGGKNFLYTHRDKVALEYLQRDGLMNLFSGLVTRENGFPLKPAPDALRWMLREYALEPAECLMIGDRAIDVKAGENAGIAGCLFDPGANTAEPDGSADTAGLFSMIRRSLGKDGGCDTDEKNFYKNTENPQIVK